MLKTKKQSSGVSPVIGIILMVAVTVGLVALASTIVFDLGSNVNEPADVSANLNFDENDNEVIAEVVRNDNAQKVSVRYDDGASDKPTKEVASSIGNTGTETVTKSELCDDNTDSSHSGTAEIVANVGTTDNQQVIRTADYSLDCSGT